MGGPSGGNSGGGGNNNKTKFGYTKPKSTLQKVGDFIQGGGIVGSVIRGVKEGAKKSKANVMDYEGQAAGVTPMRAPKDARTGRDNDNNNQPTQKSIEQPKVASQMDNSNVKSDLITAEAPAVTEMTADEIALKNKRKGRKKTILTSVTGVNQYPTLSKKTLLG
jgi:hypothetical protein